MTEEIKLIDKLNSWNEFQPLALRTESHIDSVKTNERFLVALLVANISVTEILDAVKKQVFYGNPDKLFNSTVGHIVNLESALAILKEDLAPDSLEQTVKIDPRVFHGLIGIITESGELAEALFNSITSGEAIDKTNIQEEATGDIGWYQAILNDALKLDQYQGLTNVINKLIKRYPEKFTKELAANRNLEEERKQLEVGINS